MNNIKPGKQISEARKKHGLTQAELADKCRLNIRTIQRIESGDVTPRAYTIRIINEVLGTQVKIDASQDLEDQELAKLREIFKKRKRIRIITALSAIFLMIAIVLLAFPSWELFGMPKRTWAPFFYLIMFAHLLGIGLTWRCPGCNGLLGDVFNTRFCPKCGLKFYN